MTVDRLSSSPTKSYLTTGPSHTITEKIIFRIGYPLIHLPDTSEQEGIETIRIGCKFVNSCQELLYEKSSS